MAQSHAHAQPDAERPRAVLVSAMRNEGPFILEWVAYHRVIGFDRIVICANPSSDGTDGLLAALDLAGVVTYLPTRPAPDQSPLEAAKTAFETHVGYHDGSWYCWLDADEFLNIHVGDRTVDALVAALGSARGIMLNWRLFGTNGHDSFPGRFISDGFTQAARPNFVAHLETKSFFCRSADVVGFARIGQERPQLAAGHALGAEDFLGGNGLPLSAGEARTINWLAGRPPQRTNLAARTELGAALAQINHYAVRTPEFYRLKRTRGRGYLKTGHVAGHQRYTDELFDRFDRNEAEDRSILAWEQAVSDEIDRLMADPAVATAKAEVDALVAAALREMEEAERATSLAAELTKGPEMEEMEQEAGAPSFRLTFDVKERRFLRAIYEQSETILEYGSGGSTVLAAELGRKVFSVESDQAWAERLKAHLAPISDQAHVHWADIGPTGAWGVPKRARNFRKFPAYALSVWDRPDFVQPDLVLIDGRFRCACLVAVLLRTTRPVTVLFDDYLKRGYYHGVEALARKEEMIGRMARFTVTPGVIPPQMVTEAIGWFNDPR